MIAMTTNVTQPTQPVAPIFIPPVTGFSRFVITFAVVPDHGAPACGGTGVCPVSAGSRSSGGQIGG